MRLLKVGCSAAIAAGMLLVAAGQAAVVPVQLIDNGSFAEGADGFASWIVREQPGSAGSWALQTGAFSPTTGIPVPLPPGLAHAAMADPYGPASIVLSQVLTFPVLGVPVRAATFSANVYINNAAEDFFNPPSQDYRFDQVGANQQFWIRLAKGFAEPSGVELDDVLLPIYQTQPGDLRTWPDYTPIVVDLDAELINEMQGETAQLAIGLTSNLFFFVVGITNLELVVVPIPEPSSLWLMLIGGGLGLVALRRRWLRSRDRNVARA